MKFTWMAATESLVESRAHVLWTIDSFLSSFLVKFLIEAFLGSFIGKDHVLHRAAIIFDDKMYKIKI